MHLLHRSIRASDQILDIFYVTGMEFLSLSRRRSSSRNFPSREEQGETDVFAGYVILWDQFRFLGNCPPTPSLTQHFAPSETYMLTLSQGSGRWAVSQKPKLILVPTQQNGNGSTLLQSTFLTCLLTTLLNVAAV